MMLSASAGGGRLRLSERWGLGLLATILVVFGLLVEYRSVFLSRRMGDLGVFLRAGWAARKGGEQLFTITCNNGWHYNYPPLLAVLLIPLADPPPGETAGAGLPYAVSVGLWYVA